MKLLNLLGCTSKSAVAVVPQETRSSPEPSTTIDASHAIDYENAGLVARAYMGRPEPYDRPVSRSQHSYRDINCLYMKDGRLWER